MSTGHETNQKYSSGVVFVTQYIPQGWFKFLQKKKRSYPFSSGTARRKKAKKSFSSDWAEKSAESDKGSYFDQEQWLRELNEQPSAECNPSVSSSTCSASRSKITVKEPLADLESTVQNMAKDPWPRDRSRRKTAGEDERISDLLLLSRKRSTRGEFRK